MKAPFNKAEIILVAIIILPLAAWLGAAGAVRVELENIRRWWRGHWTIEELED
jgi:hypothetical protein